MAIHNEINVIMQGGCMECPLCHSQRRWRFKRDFVGFSSQGSRISQDNFRSVEDFIVSADNKIRFSMHCLTCGVVMETESMELINEENYDKYKEDE